MPTEIRSAVADRISSWQHDDTLLLGQAANTGPEAENSQTILLGQSHSGVEPAPGVGVGVVLQGRFKLVELIGEGGMSRVYKAIDLRRVEARSPNPFLAVKVLTVPFDQYFGSIRRWVAKPTSCAA